VAALPDEDRRRTWAHLMRELRDRNLGTITVTKAQLRAALDATDAWIDSNQTGFNNAIPQPARGAMSTEQKTLMFCLVAMRRAGILRALEDG
jgi:hypothetical protein